MSGSTPREDFGMRTHDARALSDLAGRDRQVEALSAQSRSSWSWSSWIARRRRRVSSWLVRGFAAAAVGGGLVFGLAHPASAAEITVGAGCSLDDAIRAANTDAVVGGCNAGAGADVITLPAGTFTIGTSFPANPDGNGLPTISSHITFNGAGKGATFIDGAGAHRPFFIGRDTGPSPFVSFNDLTIQNGLAKGGDSYQGGGGAGLGGAMFVYRGNVTISNVDFANNHAQGGAGDSEAMSNGGGGMQGDAGQDGLGAGGGDGRRIDDYASGGPNPRHGGAYNAGSGGTGSEFVMSNYSGPRASTSGGGGGFGGGGGGAYEFDPPPGSVLARPQAGDGGFGGGGGSAVADYGFGRAGDGGFGGGGGMTAETLFGVPGEDYAGTGGTGGFGGGGGLGDPYAGSGGTGGFGGGSAGVTGSYGDPVRVASGGGGAGFGGAVFIKSGELTLDGVSFSNNSAAGGSGFEAGEGRGGAVFICTPAESGAECSADVIECEDVTFTGNTADSGEPDVFGSLTPAAALPCEAPIAPVECEGQPVTIDMNTPGQDGVGTEGDDVILGTPGDDIIEALGGNDLICAGGGDDSVDAGAGDDIVFGAGGADSVIAGEGDDMLYGGPGNDILIGKAGADVLWGEDGDDTLHGNLGPDDLVGGPGNDRLFGYGDNDRLDGGDGDDRLHGNRGNDIINGGLGNDWIRGYADDDTIDGGDGNDEISGNFGDDTIDGKSGDDLIWGADGDDIVRGGDGDDIVNGNSLNDEVYGGTGADTVDGGIGTDLCHGGADSDTDTAARCETIIKFP